MRYEQLAASNAGSKQQADTQRATVAQQQALIRSDQAAIDNAQATLSYTKIAAPLSGRAGLRQVDQDNIIHAADATGPVIITQLQPIAVQFSLPQQQIMRVNAAAGKGALVVDVFGNDGVTVVDTGVMVGEDRALSACDPKRDLALPRHPQTDQHDAAVCLSGPSAKKAARRSTLTTAAPWAFSRGCGRACRSGLTDLSEPTLAALKDIIPSFASAANPLDVTATLLGNGAMFPRIFDMIGREPGSDTFLIGVPV